MRVTERGSQYTANAFTTLCAKHRIAQSMSRSGSCLGNAAAESFATLKTEFVYRAVLPTKTHARQQLIRWFERYNRVRRHSHCGWRASIAYEKITYKAARAA